MTEKTPIMYFVINHICIEDIDKHGNLIKGGSIEVGVTDNVRWKNAQDIGDSGGNELTWMTVIITENGTKEQRFTPSLSVEFFSYHPAEPIHALMHQYITELLKIAHQIREEQLTQSQARERYFGYDITKKNSSYDSKAYF